MSKMRLDHFIAASCQRTQNMDANEAVIFARELLKVRARAFETQYPEYKALRFVPRNTEVDELDEAYTYRIFSETGTAELMSDYSNTAPRADVSGVEATPQKIKPIVASYGYSFMEARRAAKLGNELPMRKANAARRAIAQEVNRVLTYGDSIKTGVTLAGLLTLTGTLTYSTPNGAAGSKTWALKTADEVILDMTSMVTQVIVNSNDIEHPDTLILPLSSYESIKSRRMGDGSDKTILNYFRELRPEITVEGWYAAESDGALSVWTGKRMMAYQRNAEKLDAILPIEFEQLAPDVTAMETVTKCHARVGGVMLYYPKSVIYGDGI